MGREILQQLDPNNFCRTVLGEGGREPQRAAAELGGRHGPSAKSSKQIATSRKRGEDISRGAGMGKGIGRMKIDWSGKYTIEANITASTAPEAPSEA